VNSLMRLLNRKKDFYAGGLMILFGSFMALKGPTYELGTLMHMGPGFMPTALGVILVILGILIAAPALGAPESYDDERILPEHPQWWAWLCILSGPVLFNVLGSYGGLIPGTFACVFVSALGDRTTTWKGALGLAVFITVFGVVLFSYILRVPMPILEWRGF
jgi:putative Ca2+/H+ antiporter (TMEM165/GDT1 family)